MAKTITIVLPVLDDWQSFAGLVSEISGRFTGTDPSLHIRAVDEGPAEPFAAADLLPKDSCLASIEIIRLAADPGGQPAIAAGAYAPADGSESDAIVAVDGDGADRPANNAPLSAGRRERSRHVVPARRAKRREPRTFGFCRDGLRADVSGIDPRSRRSWRSSHDPDDAGSSAVPGTFARALKHPRGADRPFAIGARDRIADARRPFARGFADDFRVPEQAWALRHIDGSLPASALAIDAANPVCKQETSVCRKRRAADFLLSIVIPCFNEEEVIATTYHRVVDVLGSRNFRLQLIFVDDGSKDRTGDIITRIAAEDARVTLVSLSRNFGHQAAVSAGLEHSCGNATVIIDADLQDPPEAILGMIDKWLEGYDVVYGVRMKRKEARWKRLCYRLFYRVLNKVTSIDTPLDAGDFSLIDERVLNEINRLPEKNRFFRGLRAWVGFEQIGFRYERAPRIAGVTKYPFLKLLKLAADGIFDFSTVPLTVVLYIGCILSFLSLISLTITMLSKQLVALNAAAPIIAAILFIGGMQTICAGILGEYIGRIYQEVKGRPYFIARSHPVAASTVSDRDGHKPRPERAFEPGEAANSRGAGGSAS